MQTVKISQRGLIFSCFGMYVFQRPMLFANLYGAERDLTTSIDQPSLYLVGLTFNHRWAIGVFRFWTFLKSSCFRSLYGALDLKNNYCAKKIRKFYLLAIAHGG